ncbi:MAG: transglutaminase domain-containing protein [Labilithrix sp.]|nr:transglutaminase domain-containing protein [Labilithrix sp.]
MMRFLPASVAAAVVALMSALRGLGPISRGIAIACAAAALVAAAALRRRDVRAHASVVAGIAAVTAAGQVAGGWLYGACVAAFFTAALLSLRAARASGQPRPAPSAAALVKIGGVTGAIVVLALLLLTPIALRVERFVNGILGVDGDETTAFSTTMRLGATRGMLQSNAIVARIEGAPGVEYLRGAVYDTYNGAYWITSSEGGKRTTSAARPGAPARITLDRNAPAGADMRWFLPPGACGFDRDVEVDAFGVVRRGSAPNPQRLGFATAGCAPIAARPPTERDLEVLRDVRDRIEPLAAAATARAATPHDKLLALSREPFRGFEYSLAVERDPGVDPIADFMTVHRAGHCEMFASAMVLMARTQGIPARVVGGYRASEVNPITGQTVVRDRNAHAWVEAWYDGAWHAFDPTPGSDAPLRRGFLDHAGDLWDLALDRLAEIGPLGYAAGLGALVVVLLAIRQATNWLRRPRRVRAARAMERPLPCFETLLRALEEAGFARDPSEPLESFAARVPPVAAAAVAAYAAFRYGGVGDERAVVQEVEIAARETRAAI